MSNVVSDAIQMLGLESFPSPEQIRAAYLHRVKLFPPDREPERFREIHAAYQILNDPLAQAKQMLDPPSRQVDLMQVIEGLSQRKANLSVSDLLALGNVQ